MIYIYIYIYMIYISITYVLPVTLDVNLISGTK